MFANPLRSLATVLCLMPFAAAAQDRPATTTMDWTGGYVGLGYGQTDGDFEVNTGYQTTLRSGTITSWFSGYQVQRGQLVYGGEIARVDSDDTFVGSGISDLISGSTDLTFRIGYPIDNVLIYGVAGVSVATHDASRFGGSIDPLYGINYGFGADFAVTDNWIVGAQFLTRDTTSGNDLYDVDIVFQTVALRLSYKF